MYLFYFSASTFTLNQNGSSANPRMSTQLPFSTISTMSTLSISDIDLGLWNLRARRQFSTESGPFKPGSGFTSETSSLSRSLPNLVDHDYHSSIISKNIASFNRLESVPEMLNEGTPSPFRDHINGDVTDHSACNEHVNCDDIEHCKCIDHANGDIVVLKNCNHVDKDIAAHDTCVDYVNGDIAGHGMCNNQVDNLDIAEQDTCNNQVDGDIAGHDTCVDYVDGDIAGHGSCENQVELAINNYL